MSKIEVGDKITAPYDACDGGVRVVTAVGTEKLLYKVLDAKGGMLIMKGECTATISRCKKVEPFFEVGKTYISSRATTKYRVVEIREFGGAKWAVSEATSSRDCGGIEVLEEGDFRRMTEVSGE